MLIDLSLSLIFKVIPNIHLAKRNMKNLSAFIVFLMLSATLLAQDSQTARKTASNWEPLVPSAISEYTATILSSSFTLPMIRFNPTMRDENRSGTVEAFRSVGAGIGLNWGRLIYTTDGNRQPLVSEFKNTLGLQLGFLFSSKAGEDKTNVFALTGGMNILNFQVGIGHEFGDIVKNQKRTFFTVAYNIPLTVLVKSAYHVLLRSPSSIDSYPIVASPEPSDDD